MPSRLTWAVTAKVAASQLPTGSAALAAELLAKTAIDWLLQYEIEGDEGFDWLNTEERLKKNPELATLVEQLIKRQN